MKHFRSISFRMAAASDLRSESYAGRMMTVVPVVALKEGVIWPINAPTAELVPAASFQVAPSSWNGRPIFPGHPVQDGSQVSGNTPDILASSSIGIVFNTSVDDTSLLMEAWLDDERASNEIERLRAGQTIEVSVGAFVLAEDTKGMYNGKPYGAV